MAVHPIKESTLRLPARLASVVAVGAATLSLPLAAPAAADAAYGAIAINTHTGAWGISHSYATLSSAKRRALDECPGYCRIAVWTRNKCGAVIETPSGYFVGAGYTRSAAFRNAINRSYSYTYRRVAWMCSG